jgi:ankyrin repeat protein
VFLRHLLLTVALALAALTRAGIAQVPPSADEIKAYAGLHAAAARGDSAEIKRLIAGGAKIDARENGRTPLHVAVFGGRRAAAQTLLDLKADPNAFDSRRYDIVTIAAVQNDVDMLKIALAGGGNPRAVTSPYDGTALIAAAHLGHVEVVRTLIAAGAPLDHVNNLGWTALIEAVVLGDGGRNHTETVAALVKAGANVNIPDRGGQTPLALAQARRYTAIADILRAAGAR